MFMKRRLSLLSSFLLFTLLILGNPLKAQDAANGETLFKANCNSCHQMGKAIAAPNLQGVKDRWANEELLYQWIKNPSSVLESGDSYANGLYGEWELKGGLMPAQAVTDAQIADILEYITNWAPPAPLKVEGPVDTGSGVTWDENIMILSLILIALLLVLGLVLTIRGRINRIIAEKEGKVGAGKPSPIQVLIEELKDFFLNQMNPTILVLTVGGVVTLPVLLYMYSAGQDLGAQIGYAPDQPIKFSHKLHAGQYGIDCQYCHTGVEKSKNANIPSANICMNCHTVVQNGPKYGTEEISKIYAAIGYDTGTGSYTGEEKPIEWVRIHNLPDHVSFNHKQHVVAGNLDCENCHGNVREMEVVQQVSTLEMGWCINCHRETEVMIDNNYYQEHFHQVFKDDYAAFIKDNPEKAEEVTMGDFIKNHKKYTVGDLGGLECQRCHY